jgi:phage gp29-like protein
MIGFTKTVESAPSRRRFSFNTISSWFQRNHKDQFNGGLFEKSSFGVWTETINPLHNITLTRAQDIFDRARRGIYAELTWLYQEIESADPTLFICCERREAATTAADWRIITTPAERVRGWEETLADEQRDFLEGAYGAAGDDLAAAAEHLSRAFFRGFAHARPVFGADAQSLDGFDLFDQWNFARDPATGEWWWNPDASVIANDSFQLIPQGEIVSVVRSRHIDFPSLAIAIRLALGEKKWGIFLERYGIPPVTIIMPEFADKGEETTYMAAAEKLAKAGSGALPFGAQVNYANEARGVNPFADFLRHQQELTVMLATGGLLTTLAQSGSGTLAGNAHSETWRAVVARDIRVIARAFNQVVTSRLLDAAFPGRPHLALFEFDPDASPSASDVLDHAAKAKTAGYLIDREDLENRTGYRLVPDPAAVAAPQPGGIANKVEPAAVPVVAPPAAPDARLQALADAMAGQVKPIGDAIVRLLAAPESERRALADALIDQLPSLAPDDPMLAATIEQLLAETFADRLATKDAAHE